MTTVPCTTPQDRPPASTSSRRARHLARRGLAVAAALAVVGAACGDDDTTETGTGTDAGGGEGGTTIEFVAPVDGDEVEAPFEVEIDPGVDIGEPDTGLAHVHLYYDGNISDDTSDYDILYDETFTVERDLGEGEHTLEAVVANADHSLTDLSAEITVTVGGGAGGGTEATDSDGYDY